MTLPSSNGSVEVCQVPKGPLGYAKFYHAPIVLSGREGSTKLYQTPPASIELYYSSLSSRVLHQAPKFSPSSSELQRPPLSYNKFCTYYWAPVASFSFKASVKIPLSSSECATTSLSFEFRTGIHWVLSSFEGPTAPDRPLQNSADLLILQQSLLSSAIILGAPLRFTEFCWNQPISNFLSRVFLKYEDSTLL